MFRPLGFSSTFRSLTLAGAAALTLGLAACGDEEGGGGSSEAAKPATAAFTLTGSGKNVRLSGPDSVPAGVVNLVLNSSVKGDHGVQLVKVEGDLTAEQVGKAGDAWGDRGKALPDAMRLEGGVVAMGKKVSKSTQVLTPGRYLALDVQAEGGKTPTAEFEVTGDGGDAALTEPDAKITMKDYAFEGTGLTAGREQQVLVENTGKEPHFIVGAPLAKGATVKEAQKFFSTEGEPEGPPPADFENAFSTSVMEGGGKMVLGLPLKTGKYVFVCFVPDRAGGPPHVAKGMVSEVTVG